MALRARAVVIMCINIRAARTRDVMLKVATVSEVEIRNVKM